MEVIIIPVTDSPLRYPGGKTQMKNFIVDLLKQNALIGSTYIEPFAGGAGLAVSLLYNKMVRKIHINDLDITIYYLWTSILNNTECFIRLINETPITMEEWYRQKEIHINYELYSPLQVGFSTFFLNRTNVSGIITGGPLGGKQQTSKNKLDCRFNKANLIKKIQKIASYKDFITVTNEDASFFIDDYISNMNPNETFIFFDPPYYQQGKNLYSNYYGHKDHLTLCNKIKSLRDYYWITTYDLSREIEKMYQNQRKKIYTLNYSANNKRKAEELLFLSDNISLPDSNYINYIKKDTSIKMIN
jgi:DNA adenine methylase